MTKNNVHIAPFSRYDDITKTISIYISGSAINGN